MNRSTSYFATASAILSVPSTWTSSRVKFLANINKLYRDRGGGFLTW